MKKIVYAILAIVMVACNQSPEKKVNALIQESVKKSLYHPESYEAVETIIDSAFAPKDDPAFYEKTLKIYHYAKDLQECTEEIQQAERSMNIWHSSYMSEYARAEYNHAKQKHDDYILKEEKLKNKIRKAYEELWKIAETGRQFIGFKATHKFRAKNNAGNTLMGENVYIMNEDLTKILASYDADSEEYFAVQALYQSWAEELEEALEEWQKIYEEAKAMEE